MQEDGKKDDAIQSKDFGLGDVLSITMGYVFAPHFMEGVNSILGFMGGSPEKCKHHLAMQFPQLFTPEMNNAVAELKTALDTCKDGKEAKVRISTDWLNKQIAKYGETFAVKPIPKCPTCGHLV